MPLAPKDDWDTVKEFAQGDRRAHGDGRFPTASSPRAAPKNRVGKIFVDYLRNGFGATTACAWSARARPGLGVSVPCAWDELGALTGGDALDDRATSHERIEERADPWRDYAKTRQTLAKAMKKLLGA